MTNRIALFLALFIAALIALDLYLLACAQLVFLGRKLFDLLDWLAFWR